MSSPLTPCLPTPDSPNVLEDTGVRNKIYRDSEYGENLMILASCVFFCVYGLLLVVTLLAMNAT